MKRTRLLSHQKQKLIFLAGKIFFIFLLWLIFQNPVWAGNKPPVIINISARAGLQYDLVRFKVNPGEEINIVFNNSDDMSHNLVITQPGTREKVVNAALKLGDQGPALDFVPQTPDVFKYIAVLAPGETKTLSFTAPQKAGVYPYVCTYPGHGFVMFGAMYVGTAALPPLEKDLNIPAARRSEKDETNINQHATHTAGTPALAVPKNIHPYQPVAPYLYRVFIADAGPAAIAVHLPNNLSYCWDAGSCRLRYAWQGEFLDNTDFWKGHKDGNVKVMGTIFYRDKARFPLRFNTSENIPEVKFKGYKLINRYPEFHYLVDGVEVFEIIHPKADGTGLVRSFRIPNSLKPVWFTFNKEDGVEYSSDKGKAITKNLKLTPKQARKFTIIMTKKAGVDL